jgi:serine/threonine protein kinase
VIEFFLQPENLLFTDKTPNATLKLIDFGMAKHYTGEPLRDWCGTPEFQGTVLLDHFLLLLPHPSSLFHSSILSLSFFPL